MLDTRIAHNEAESLIGFIQKVADRFEVMEFGDPVKFLFFDTMNASLSYLTRPKAVIEPARAS